MEQAGRPSKGCSLPHDPLTQLPQLGVSNLIPSLNPRTLPELLGFKDEDDPEFPKQIAQVYPYAFNMGGSKVLPLKDYKEAGRLLMERNMPDLLRDEQTEVIFVPETHLPTMPRVVDPERFETRKRPFDEMAGLLSPESESRRAGASWRRDKQRKIKQTRQFKVKTR